VQWASSQLGLIFGDHRPSILDDLVESFLMSPSRSVFALATIFVAEDVYDSVRDDRGGNPPPHLVAVGLHRFSLRVWLAWGNTKPHCFIGLSRQRAKAASKWETFQNLVSDVLSLKNPLSVSVARRVDQTVVDDS
jgi:hypothetical protein